MVAAVDALAVKTRYWRKNALAPYTSSGANNLMNDVHSNRYSTPRSSDGMTQHRITARPRTSNGLTSLRRRIRLAVRVRSKTPTGAHSIGRVMVTHHFRCRHRAIA